MSTMTMAGALNAALAAEMDRDEKTVLMGEDIGALGGVFRVTDGLQARFGKHRVMDTPLAESGIVGTAIGLAMRGFRPVVEVQFDGFVYPAFDQIVSNLAKLHYRTRGAVSLPVTIRIPFGGGIGSPEHHSESPEAYFAHTAGLRVVSASTPQEAYSTLRAAIACDDPVVFLEPKRRYWGKGEVDPDRDADLTRAAVVRPGTDATVVAYGPLVATARDAATAAEDEGIDLEVIDLRSLYPLDLATLEASVRKTGRLLVTHEAAEFGGLGAEIVAVLTTRCFYSLQAPPERVTGFDIPYPPARLEDHHLPDLDRILDAVDRLVGRDNSQTGSRFDALAGPSTTSSLIGAAS
ncbi:alpha-ketoacid dehydrogenase subunit beta [Tersicoccus phoenicis]|uniref:Alpha-ketoacid dehydrogenase subunit beta n=1 Tax=Tersicoccus phoenicis TaxID=554083 RepID=A0A1R1L9G1_9MICC|nr:alpha-ketoacid dehydrogenase subunit beta [Tersicoccus phoenicis]OMH24182.1 alpha-ketoacid dehydrogenase subunit beta [Tersicoccus phoenicis]